MATLLAKKGEWDEADLVPGVSRQNVAYQARYPDRAAWPTSRMKRFHEPLGEVRQIPVDVWRAMLAVMPPSKTKACLEVFAETGIRSLVRSRQGTLCFTHYSCSM